MGERVSIGTARATYHVPRVVTANGESGGLFQISLAPGGGYIVSLF